MENKKIEELGTKIILVLKENGYSDLEIENILITTLKSVVSEMNENKCILNDFEKLLGSKLFDDLLDDED